MAIPREDRLAIAKMALEHLADLETNNSHSYTAAIARQAGTTNEHATFEKIHFQDKGILFGCQGGQEGRFHGQLPMPNTF